VRGPKNDRLDFGGDPYDSPDQGFLNADHDRDPGILKGFFNAIPIETVYSKT